MDLSRPYSLVSSSADPDVLATLVGSGQPLSGREVARRAGRAQNWVLTVLNRLVAHGVVEHERAGRTHLYRLNRDHLAVPVLEGLVGLRIALVDRLRAELAGWGVEPVSAILFGSAARGDGGLDSDIDILLIRRAGVDADDPRWREQTDGLSERVHAWTGNSASVVEMDEEDLARLGDRVPPVLLSVRSDGIHLAGRGIDSLLRASM